MYTQGVRKIFFPKKAGMKLEDVQYKAFYTDYDALCFNGDIWVRSDTDITCQDVHWVQTPFHIKDFSDAPEYR